MEQQGMHYVSRKLATPLFKALITTANWLAAITATHELHKVGDDLFTPLTTKDRHAECRDGRQAYGRQAMRQI